MAITHKVRLRQYGAFTPAGIAEAMEIAKTLPVPRTDLEIATLGGIRKGRAIKYNIGLPIAVAWRLKRISQARGIPMGRVMLEILSYYVVAVNEASLDGVPGLYADFVTHEGMEVLTAAFTEALRRVRDNEPSSLDFDRSRSRAEVYRPEPQVPPEPEPAITPQALDAFSLDDGDEMPTLTITIRADSANGVCRALADLQDFIRDNDPEAWDDVRSAEPGYEYECRTDRVGLPA